MLELARESDWEAVSTLAVQIHNLHVAWRPDVYCQSEEPYPKEKFLADIQSRMVYVAKLNQSVVGYVVLATRTKSGPGLVTRKQMLLEALCVEETLRRHGIGMEIMADVRALARAFRCQELLLSVQPENESAIAFYQKCGFSLRNVNMDLKP